MRIYLSLQNPSFLRNLEPAARLLIERGHSVILGIGEDSERGNYLRSFVESVPADSLIVTTPPVRADRWSLAASQLRVTIDYLFFLGPDFLSVPYSRVRRRGEPPELARRLIRRYRLRYGWRRLAALRWLSRVEESIPPDPNLVDHIRSHRADVLLVSPLLGVDSEQLEHVRAAKALRIPTVYAVHSWDNLTSKGLIRMRPEGVAVWNDVQKAEALTLQNQPRDRITVTGAYNFDSWFEAKPSMDRASFLQQVGLPAERPVILYLCSALYFPKTEPEEAFIREWVAKIRQSEDAELSKASILVRPHPKRRLDRSSFGAGVAAWPLQGELPTGQKRQQVFFDSLYHADAVVGLNTTAMIEAAIIGRPVHTILHERYRVSQDNTLHFPYLTDAETGVLRVAADWDTHLRQLSEAIARDFDPGRTARFVQRFVRPRGLDCAGSPALADCIESVAKNRGRMMPLRGAWLRLMGLNPIEFISRRAEIEEKRKVRWTRVQTVGDWHMRQIFLQELRAAAQNHKVD